MIKKYVIDEGKDAEAVREIFRLCKEKGPGSYQIADWMNRNEYTYKGKKFTATAVSRILDNTFYVGVTPWGKTSERLQELRLIEDETFMVVQEIRSQRIRENEESQTMAMKSRSMLGGNMEYLCKHCGHRMVSIISGEVYEKRWNCGSGGISEILLLS